MAMVLDAFVRNLVGKLRNIADEEMRMQLGVKEEVGRLLRRLERLKGFLQHAEQQKYTDARIATLAKELKDVIYDADDIIDTCMMEDGKLLRVERPTPSTVCSHPFIMLSSCFRCFKYRREVGLDIRKLTDRLDEIAKDNLITAFSRTRIDQSVKGNRDRSLPSSTRGSSHIHDGTRIVGSQIEQAAQEVVSSIVNHDDEDKYAIFAITGMGGIGKTTLARKIFSDEKIIGKFPAEPSEEKTSGMGGVVGRTVSRKVLNDGNMSRNFPQTQPNDEKMTTKFSKRRIWLHVFKNYSETGLLQEMVRNLGGDDKGEKSRAELEDKLTKLLPESLFLVLDDIWSEDVWHELLRGPIMHQKATKCRILVTTRDEKIATSLKATNIHHVDRMDEESGWELLCKEVFDDVGGKEEIQSLSETGRAIVEKCRGLPLAIKAIAGVLRRKDANVTEWDIVLRSEMWSVRRINDELPSALYMSYTDLTPDLKQCFLYCSWLSAKTGGMSRADLVTYWVDEGFVAIKEGNPSSMEEIAEGWYRELLWRNLLQRDPDYRDDKFCYMHDLLRSLGQYLIEGEATCISGHEISVSTSSLTKMRRLLMISYDGETLTIPSGITEPEHLRNLFVKSHRVNSIGDDLFGKLRNLRMLMLPDTSIQELPHCIGDLFHLRHLDLDRTHIKEIPSSIGRLSNLQTLRAGGCQYLQQFPSAITSLRKLRVLHVRDTPLTHVPKGIGRLNGLNRIEGLIIGHQDGEQGCDLDELQHLSCLRVLRLHKLHRSSGESSTSTIADKSSLWHLVLSERSANLSEEQIRRAQKIYDGLIPPSSIRKLELQNFPGFEFPRWIMSPSLGDSFPKLSSLLLHKATLCKELPPGISHLPILTVLEIIGANAITKIGPQFFSPRPGGAAAFPKLEHMSFWKMPNWKEWSSSNDNDEVDQLVGGGVESTNAKKQQLLPNLRTLTLLDCPKLKALPTCLSLATNLKKVWIRACDLRKIDNLPSLSDTMYVDECERLERLCKLPSLKKLAVVNCPRLEHVDNLDRLQYLLIWTHAKSLPQWLTRLILQPSFMKFGMYCSLKLFKDCLRTGPNWHIIQQIPQVSIRSLDESQYMRYTKDLSDSYEVGRKRLGVDDSYASEGSEPDEEDGNNDKGDGDDDTHNGSNSSSESEKVDDDDVSSMDVLDVDSDVDFPYFD